MAEKSQAAGEEFAWEFRCKGTGDPDSAFGPWRAVQEGRIEVNSPYSSHFEFRRVSAQFANYFTQCEERSATGRCSKNEGHEGLHHNGIVQWAGSDLAAEPQRPCGKYSRPSRFGGVLGPCKLKPGHETFPTATWHLDENGAAWDPATDRQQATP